MKFISETVKVDWDKLKKECVNKEIPGVRFITASWKVRNTNLVNCSTDDGVTSMKNSATDQAL